MKIPNDGINVTPKPKATPVKPVEPEQDALETEDADTTQDKE